MEKMPLKLENIRKIVETQSSLELIDCFNKKEMEGKFVSIGEGGNAVVFIAEGTPFEKGIVFKKIKEKPQMHCNEIDEECRLQKRAKDMGINTPLTLIYAEIEGESYLVMERIDGNSIKDIVSNPDLMPESFNYKVFVTDLESQIKKMNNGDLRNEGIYHGDLHSGNVMVDNKTGLPIIIDFGTATEGSGGDNTYNRPVRLLDQKTGRYNLVMNGYLKDDMDMLKIIKSELKIFIKE